MAGKRTIRLKTIPGEPTDGTGIMSIHLFVQDERGPFIEPLALHPKIGEDGQPVRGQVVGRPTRGRLACDPRRSAVPVTRGNETFVTMRTDAAEAVTCPRCKQSREYKEAMKG